MSSNKILIGLLLLLAVGCFGQERDTVLIDMGNMQLSPAPWNNLLLPRTGSLSVLYRTDSLESGYSIAVTDRFNGINNSGTDSPNVDLEIDPLASGDSFFGNTVTFSDVVEPTGAVTISGLTDGKVYLVELFASRVATDNRETRYVVSGATIDTVYLQVSNNIDTIVSSSVEPNTDGEITVHCSPGPNNDSEFGFFYLGALRLSYPAEDSPVEPSLALLQPRRNAVIWNQGQIGKIRWSSQGLSEVELAYSLDDGNTFNVIASVSGAVQSYDWLLPTLPSGSRSLILRVRGGNLVSQEEIFAGVDFGVCNIVVIGSSTAAGTGASVSDSAWVNRFSRFLETRNYLTVTNLARGGYTTYHLLPRDYVVEGGAPIEVDTLRNIDAALALNPNIIIINLPSNDAARDYPANDQIRNFAAMVDRAADVDPNVRTYVATTQPRNFAESTRRMMQEEVRDLIRSTFDFTLDFWTGVAAADATILPQYDSGDGVHLNDAGHALLAREAISTESWVTDCELFGSTTDQGRNQPELMIFPNPSSDDLTVEVSLQEAGSYTLEMHSNNGQRVFINADLQVDAPGTHRWAIDGRHLQHLPRGHYVVTLHRQGIVSVATKVILQ